MVVTYFVPNVLTAKYLPTVLTSSYYVHYSEKHRFIRLQIFVNHNSIISLSWWYRNKRICCRFSSRQGSIWWQATGDFEKQRGFYMVRKSIFEYIVYNWSEIAVPSIAVLLFILLNKRGKKFNLSIGKLSSASNFDSSKVSILSYIVTYIPFMRDLKCIYMR